MRTILIDACKDLAENFNDFWLLAALGDWSYEEGVRAPGYRKYLTSWSGLGLSSALDHQLQIGINGNLAEILGRHPAVSPPVIQNVSNGPDIEFENRETGKRAIIEVKLIYDCTLTKYYREVVVDRDKLRHRARKEVRGFQAVFFTQLPCLHYPRGYWYGAARPSAARQCNKRGIVNQFTFLLSTLGDEPNWPLGGPLVCPLAFPCSTIDESRIRERYENVFRPKELGSLMPHSNYGMRR